MDKFTKSLLSMIAASRDIDIISDALNLTIAELERVTTTSAATPVVGAVSVPVTCEDVAKQELEDEPPFALAADKHSAYIAIYGASNFLLLDEEDDIEVGDEWIIKPEEVTSRARVWRTANDIGHKVGEFQRSHYRRAI